jgi:hypothetical protein
MSHLLINDLTRSKHLDTAAARKICGGTWNTGLCVARPQQHHLSSPSAPASIYNIVNNNYNVINENPTFFNVSNGDHNSGTIVNSFNTFSLSAASPALIGG